jgi:hypothetical protein
MRLSTALGRKGFALLSETRVSGVSAGESNAVRAGALPARPGAADTTTPVAGSLDAQNGDVVRQSGALDRNEQLSPDDVPLRSGDPAQ